MPDYTLLPFPIFFDLKSFSLIQVPNTLPVQYIPRPYLFISTASLPFIQKPYGLHQSPLVGGQNGTQVLGRWTFVLEEFGDNVPDYISAYISSLEVQIRWNCVEKQPKLCFSTSFKQLLLYLTVMVIALSTYQQMKSCKNVPDSCRTCITFLSAPFRNPVSKYLTSSLK